MLARIPQLSIDQAKLQTVAAKLKEVVDRIQAIDPTLLAPAPLSTPQK
jgi:hypothetical protein